MLFVAINLSNDYDVANKTRYATQEEADARAREILNQFPTAQAREPAAAPEPEAPAA